MYHLNKDIGVINYSRPVMLHLRLIFSYIFKFLRFDSIIKCLRISFLCVYFQPF